MKIEALVDIGLDRLPAYVSGIIFSFGFYRRSVSKTRYYIN